MTNDPRTTATVAAVKCPDYRSETAFAAVEKAIALAGGFPETVRPGARVLIKPNLLTAKTPDQVATTHPEIVRALVRLLKAKGVETIVIGDSPAGKHAWDELWETTGMKAVAEAENVRLLAFENFSRVRIEGVDEDIPFLRELSEFDVMISVPKAKTHILTKYTGAIKNSYGLIVGGAKSHFHGKFTSPRPMADFIARVYRHRPPDLIVMDAVECMEGDGPSGGPARHVGAVLAGRDGAALDAVACGIYGYRGEDIPTLVRAAALGAGVVDSTRIREVGDGFEIIRAARGKRSLSDLLHVLPEKFFHLLTLVVRCRPGADMALCVRCGKCVAICSQKALAFRKNGGPLTVKASRCVLCMCCVEACPVKAIELRSPGIAVMAAIRRFFRSFRKSKETSR